MFVRAIRLMSLGLVAGWASWAPPSRAAETPFSAAAYLEHVKFLASDELGGRRPGTPGIERAAQYIADQFAKAGLKPAGDDGTWFQAFRVWNGKKIVDADARLEIAGVEHAMQVKQDWIPLPFSETARVDGPLAFAGFGIAADEYDYNDYAAFDPNGHVLLVFRYEPRAEDEDAAFGGRVPSEHALFYKKARVAARRGAKALLIVNPPREDAPDGLFDFERGLSKQTFDLPMVHITPALAAAILARAGLPPMAELQQELERERKPLSQATALQVTLHPGLAADWIEAQNVVGRLPGVGDTDETIVVGAHHDHLGRMRSAFDRSDRTPRIHNGADDNASGTAAVIELAHALAHGPGLRRNVLFVTFSAEEMGLLGSRHFVEQVGAAVKQIRAVVNFDMIGRFDQGKFRVFGTTSGAELADVVRQAAEKVEVEYRAPEGVSGSSDHYPFYQREIPYLFPFTGVHQDYHRPSDDWNKIDADGAVQVLRVFQDVIAQLANMTSGPTFQAQSTKLDREEMLKKPAAEHDEKDAEALQPRRHSDTARPQRPNVRFGIIPDHAQQAQPGLVVDTVLDGLPAHTAGMKRGDRIVKINDTEIRDIYGYMRMLKEFKVGDHVAVVVVRKGEEVTLEVELAESKHRPRPQ